MSSLLWIVLILFDNVIHYTLGIEIDCVSYRGPLSSSDAGATEFVECPTDHPTMVSCGFEVRQYGSSAVEEDFGGSWIDDTVAGLAPKCYAKNPNNGAGIYPHARCCKFTQDIQCRTEFGTSQTNIGQVSREICTTHNGIPTIMLGCSGRTVNNDDENFDGVYPGENDPSAYGTTSFGIDYPRPMDEECNARSNGFEVEAQANCCTASVGLECNVVYQYPGIRNNIGCPEGQTLINCMGYNINGNANAMFIAGTADGPDSVDYSDERYDNLRGRCVTRSSQAASDSGSPAPRDVYTSAICCSEYTAAPTSEPTSVPTNDPTEVPTDNPTFTYAPTEDPTEATDMPSSSPTTEPTTPTYTPTVEPTNEPTDMPTEPTSEPTMEPTGDPSPAPSLPSAAPSVSTDLPTKTPTEEPTTNIPPGSLNEGADDDGNNEELFLILFIIFGILFCCLLLGLLYYCWSKNKKQEDEVNYNNANVVVIGDGDDDVAAAMQAEGVAGTTGGGTSPGTATTYNTTNGTATTGTGTGIDASDGIAGGNPNVQLTPRGTQPGGTQTTTGNGNTSIGTIQSYASIDASTQITSNYSGVDGMSDEDDQKSDVYKVQM